MLLLTGRNVMNKKTQIRAVCVSAMCAALSVVLLLLGQALQVFDISAAVLGGIVTASVAVSFGGGYAAGQMLVCTVLSALLLPDKTGAVLYFAVGGVYPLIKPWAEKFRFPWVIKSATAVLLTGMYAAAFLLLLPSEATETVGVIPIAGICFCLLLFFLYDILLTRLIRKYGGRIMKIMRK